MYVWLQQRTLASRLPPLLSYLSLPKNGSLNKKKANSGLQSSHDEALSTRNQALQNADLQSQEELRLTSRNQALQNGDDKVPEYVDEDLEPSSSSKGVQRKKLGLADFKPLYLIGIGTFGKVFLVEKMDTGSRYAMKVIKKTHIIEKNTVDGTKAERDVLVALNHPFIVKLRFAFQVCFFF